MERDTQRGARVRHFHELTAMSSTRIVYYSEKKNGGGLVISRLGISILHLLTTNCQHQKPEWINVVFRLPCVFSSVTNNDTSRTVSAQ